MNRHMAYFGVSFGHLASLVWAKLILGRFRDAACFFLDFLLVPTIALTRFLLIPVMGDIPQYLLLR